MRVPRCASFVVALMLIGSTAASVQPRFAFPQPGRAGVQEAIQLCELLGPSEDQREFIRLVFEPIWREHRGEKVEIARVIDEQMRRIPVRLAEGRTVVLDSSQAEDALAECSSLVIEHVASTIAAVDAVLVSDHFSAMLTEAQRSRLAVVRSVMSRRVYLDASQTRWPGAGQDPVFVLLESFRANGLESDQALIAIVEAICKARSPELDALARRLFEVSVRTASHEMLAFAQEDRNAPEALAARESAWLERGAAEHKWIAATDKIIDEMLVLLDDHALVGTIRDTWTRERAPATYAGEDGVRSRVENLSRALEHEEAAASEMLSISEVAESAFARMVVREHEWRVHLSQNFRRTKAATEAYERSMWALRQRRIETVRAQLERLASLHPEKSELALALEWASEVRASLNELADERRWPRSYLVRDGSLR